MDYFWGWGRVQNSCSCSTFLLYVSVNSGIDFYLILGSFLTFWGSIGLFWGWGEVRRQGVVSGYFRVGMGSENCFGVYLYMLSTFVF